MAGGGAGLLRIVIHDCIIIFGSKCRQYATQLLEQVTESGSQQIHSEILIANHYLEKSHSKQSLYPQQVFFQQEAGQKADARKASSSPIPSPLTSVAVFARL